MYWEFTVYVTDGDVTWEGYGYWPMSVTSRDLLAAQLEMAKALEIGLNAHGLSDLSSLECYLQAIDPGDVSKRKIEESIRYRVEMAGGMLLRWSRVEKLKGENNGQG